MNISVLRFQYQKLFVSMDARLSKPHLKGRMRVMINIG
ncbi:hypothetical protein CEV31_1358 [Brucella thiophenivorans]|uniref:Uncharacterized protein n=1 Tax=Brucella thiophenivorans TaxID=571255 RepID=A0A256FYP2_9HYPH|nr:hypothetical protein CEV31_1358 [Brucella thiophenivorans]